MHVDGSGNYFSLSNQGDSGSMKLVWSLACLVVLSMSAGGQVFPGYGGENSQEKAEKERKHRQEVRGNYASGALHYVVRYKRGLADGTAREYYENGVLKAEVKFQNGRRDGIAKYYYESGVLKAKVLFNRDREVGKNKLYTEDGELTRTTDVSSKVRSVVEDLAKSATPVTVPPAQDSAKADSPPEE
jgi:hypothetical protein